MTQDTRQTLLIATLLLLLIGALKHAASLTAGFGEVAFMVAVLFQIFVPIRLIERKGESLKEYKICVDRKGLLQDLKRVLALALIFFPLFWLGYHTLQSYFAAQNQMRAYFSFALPADFFRFILSSAVIVSIAEEIFYRGFLQSRLLKEWPFVPAIVITNLFFASGHFIGEYHLGRLLTFFPGLLFSFLALRSRSIMGAALFHGLCNIFSELLREGYYWK